MNGSFSFNTTPALRVGSGMLCDWVADIAGILGPRVLLVTDKGVEGAGLTAPLIAAFGESSQVIVFDEVEADPSLDTLMRAVALGREAGASGVLGFGGGSPMDVAKLTALQLGGAQPIDAVWGVGQARGPRLPLVLVPTTAGTGSEVTPVAIITLGGDEKRGAVSPYLLPDMAVLDATLTLGLPAAATAATGVDAMVHAIEAYTSRSGNANPVSRALAVTALQKLGAHIERAVADGSDLEAREEMLLGAMLAGQAFANAPVAAVHALAYPLGGTFHIPHGLSNALVLAEVMRFNAPACAAEYAELAPHVFPDIGRGGANDMAAEFIDRLAGLSERLGLPPRLRDAGVPHEAIAKLARDAMGQTRLLVNNPRALNEADARAIYDAAW